MKINTGRQPFRSLHEVAITIADLARGIASGWNVDHREDGTHRFTWVDVAHDATRYTGSGTMTWGVSSGDQLLLTYRIVGDGCTVCWRIGTADVGGTASNRLLIRLPDGITPSRRVSGLHYYDNAGTEGVGLARLDSTLTKIELFLSNSASNWTLTTSDNTYTEGTLTFPITQ